MTAPTFPQADVLEREMRTREAFHTIRVGAGYFIVVRVDGRGFTKLTRPLIKPFDQRFHTAMCAAATALMHDYTGVLATIHSDEISVLLARDTTLFDRELEKLASVAAGVASAAFTSHLHGTWRHEVAGPLVGAFDGRLWIGEDTDRVVDYYAWRRADAVRGSVHSMALWALIHDGMTGRAATSELHGKNQTEQAAIAERLIGVPQPAVPVWQRHGSMLVWEEYTKPGFNPITGQDTGPAVRRRLLAMDPPPSTGGAYAALIRRLAEASLDKPAPYTP